MGTFIPADHALARLREGNLRFVADARDGGTLPTRTRRIELASGSHNPVSNMYLASGTCPVPKMLDMGITVSLGVDGPASNNGQDMFELMKTTASSSRKCQRATLRRLPLKKS